MTWAVYLGNESQYHTHAHAHTLCSQLVAQKSKVQPIDQQQEQIEHTLSLHLMLIANAPKLVKPYQEPILNGSAHCMFWMCLHPPSQPQVLIPKLKEPDANPNVVVSIMAAVGELAQVAGVTMRPWVDKLCPLLVEMLQDASSLAK